MLFDQGRELPVATVRRAPRSKLAMLAGDLSRWVATRWDWLRPRMVPVTVAFVGMLAVLQAVSYLSGPPDPGSEASDTLVIVAPEAPEATTIVLDGPPDRSGEVVPDLPRSACRIRVATAP